jgi:hypothetical protein
MGGRSARSIPHAARPLEWTRADENHVEKLAKGPLGKALSLDQLRSLYSTSLGLPDQFGNTPAYRERVQAAAMLTSNVLPRPKADEPEGHGTTFEFVNDPYGERTCPSCGHRFVETSGRGDTTTTEESEDHG